MSASERSDRAASVLANDFRGSPALTAAIDFRGLPLIFLASPLASPLPSPGGETGSSGEVSPGDGGAWSAFFFDIDRPRVHDPVLRV